MRAGFFGLGPAERGELDAVIGDSLVDGAVAVAFRLGMPD